MIRSPCWEAYGRFLNDHGRSRVKWIEYDDFRKRWEREQEMNARKDIDGIDSRLPAERESRL